MKILKIHNLLIGLTFVCLITFPFSALAQLPNPLKYQDWGSLIMAVASFVFSVAIPLAVISIIWSAILFLTAGGKEDRVTQAKRWFFWAVVGLGICLIGLGFVNLVIDVLGGRAGSAVPSQNQAYNWSNNQSVLR